MFYYKHIWQSPVGVLYGFEHDETLAFLKFHETKTGADDGSYVQKNTVFLRHVQQELDAYFRKDLKVFSIPLTLHARASAFQQATWTALREIPYGHKISYKELARRLGNPHGARAVGGACGKNPVPIIVPCHRVVNHHGGLGGYAGGREVKEWLLQQEA